MANDEAPVRRGLPRVPGGPAWPDVAGSAPVPAAPSTKIVPVEEEAPSPQSTVIQAADAQGASTPALQTVRSGPVRSGPVRRGLPRTPGGHPWPPATLTASVEISAAEPLTASNATQAPATPSVAPSPTPVAHVPSERLSAAPTAVAPTSFSASAPARSLPSSFRGRSLSWWGTRGLGLVVAAVAVTGIVVLAARGVTTLPGVPEFLERYPGEYHPAVDTENGFPAWARWTHYLNFFFLVLIVRTGLLVRQQQQPPAFVSPKRGGKKVGIYLWLHLSLDALWLLNGIVFVALLFITDHWARIVPTSVQVLPNAASALLQYLTLEWPTENGWVNYNSLQQLMYFAIVFIAAPLAAITGVRMSEWWPKNRRVLDRVYPMDLARAIHFPVMLFFVLFTITHVFLVFATGALRNLNHMFAGQDTVSWAGFWWFVAGLAVSVVAVLAARPLVLAPIAGVTGKVSNR